jgi:hypothetical protein
LLQSLHSLAQADVADRIMEALAAGYDAAGQILPIASIVLVHEVMA